MSSLPTDATVIVMARDLFFRAKIEAQVTRLGFRLVGELPASFAVIELGSPEQMGRLRRLTKGGTPVLAFGSHVDAEALRSAREAGAVAVPNSQLDSALRTFLTGQERPGGPAP